MHLLKHVLVIHCGASCRTQNLLWAILRQNCGLVLLPEVFSVNVSPFTGCLCSPPFHTVAGGQEWAHTLWTMVMGGKCQFICPCSSSHPSLRCCPSSSFHVFFVWLFFVAAEALRSHRGETHRLCAHEARKTHQTTNVSFLFLFQLEELEDTDHSILSSAHTAVEEKWL